MEELHSRTGLLRTILVLPSSIPKSLWRPEEGTPAPRDGVPAPDSWGPGRGGKIENNQQLNLKSMGIDELPLEKYSTAVPLVCYPEKSSEDGVLESKISGGTSAYKKRFISLLVTIENHTPLIELSQCLGTKALSEILEFPHEEARNSYKCPECDQSFNDNSYLVLHQKTHSGEKKHKCDARGKIFNHRANLRSHRRIHIGKRPYKCSECSSSFRQQSYLSRHMNVHIKEKAYTCGIRGKGFTCPPGLSQHLKTHDAKKAYECTNSGKYFGQKTNLALHEKHEVALHTSATQYQYIQCTKCFRQPSHLSLPEKDHQDNSEYCSDCRENLLLFSKSKPLKCPECMMTFLHMSELISHQNIHKEEKSHKCKTRGKSFILDSDLACHQESHAREEPFKCSVCGKSFKLNIHLITHQRTHSKNIM
ncbi:zinc finger protein 597 isoform X3 [Pteropus medius]|uniref:Zinc finger protein 597 isoform X3 n=1 Tax=Pteropus vampyrus TaxID=132908 RepID=A0A6P3R3I8_PTEVA|nr:zinc finger protein 597 isoform X3 [Pteropus vampyrus]XP_039741083.1 zinc finger protein 597 isoform X3 [Pteropus giganteus]